jgi:hypothetical protein
MVTAGEDFFKWMNAFPLLTQVRSRNISNISKYYIAYKLIRKEEAA